MSDDFTLGDPHAYDKELERENHGIVTESVGATAERGTPERLEQLKLAVPSLIESIEELAVYAAMGQDGKARLVFEYTLSAPAAAVAAEIVFHGNDDALPVNGWTASLGLMDLLPRSVCHLCRDLRAAAMQHPSTTEEGTEL